MVDYHSFASSSTIFMMVGLFFCLFFCDFRDVEIPVAIPNTEVKRIIADNTAPFRCGNAGHCKDVKYPRKGIKQWI